MVERYREYRRSRSPLRRRPGALLESGGLDRELRELAELELAENREKMEAAAEEMKILLLPRDPNDDKQRHRGDPRRAPAARRPPCSPPASTGCTPCTPSAGAGSWRCWTPTKPSWGATRRSASAITGEGAYSRLKFESGVHRVQRVPETETRRAHPHLHRHGGGAARGGGGGGRDRSRAICRSIPSAPAAPAASTSTRPNPPSGSPTCPPAWWWNARTSGASTKTRTRPCGCCAPGCCERKREQQRSADRRRAPQSQVGTGDRSERIRTYNFPQGRVTDHRIGLTLYKIDAIMNGDLDEIIDALITADQAPKAAGTGENALKACASAVIKKDDCYEGSNKKSPAPAAMPRRRRPGGGSCCGRGRLVAIPTETVYGLAADALNGDGGGGDFRRQGPAAG